MERSGHNRWQIGEPENGSNKIVDLDQAWLPWNYTTEITSCRGT